jgi:hypothetical protein
MPPAASGDTQQQRVLERLRKTPSQPVSFSELRAGGIDFPAAVISELELSGYAVDRVYKQGRIVGVRLLEGEQVESAGTSRVRRRRWSRRPPSAR